MMSNARPELAFEERMASEIVRSAQLKMIEAVHAAVKEAIANVRDEILAAELNVSPPSEEYFQAVIYQRMYLNICGAEDGSFSGGDARKAVGLIRNQQMISNHYWDTDIELTPLIL